MSETYPIGIVGESHYQSAISPACVGKPLSLVHEPDNQHDPNAIRVDNHRGQTMGYLPRDSWLTQAILKQRRVVAATVLSADLAPGTDFRAVVLDVSVTRPSDADTGPIAERKKIPAISWLLLIALVALLALALA